MTAQTSLFDAYDQIAASGLFDEAYYRARYADVDGEAGDALLHYLEHGAREHRQPSADFDVAYYLEQCRSLGESPDNVLLHYLQSGRALGLKHHRPAPPPELQLRGVQLAPPDLLSISGHWTGAAAPQAAELWLDGRAVSPVRIHVQANGPSAWAIRIDASVRLAPDSESQMRLSLPTSDGAVIRQLRLIADASGQALAQAQQVMPVTLTLEQPSPPPSSESVPVDGDLAVRGWTLGGSGIQTLELLIDDETVASTRPHVAREDVRVAFPQQRDALRSGFQLQIPRRRLQPGTRQLTVRATDKHGFTASTIIRLQVCETPFETGIDDRQDLLLRELRYQLDRGFAQMHADVQATRDAVRKRKSGPAQAHLNRLDVQLQRLEQAASSIQPEQLSAAQIHSSDTLELAVRSLGRHAAIGDAASKTSQRRKLQSQALRRFEPIELPADARPDVSIIIPAHNQVFFTVQCLASLARHRPQARMEVIVMDDASSDETAALASLVSGIRLLRNSRNRGFVESCNKAAQAANGSFLLFLNNDTLVTAGAIDALLDCFANPLTGIAGSKLLHTNGRLQEAGGILWRDGSGSNYGRGEDPEHPAFNFRRAVHYCSGASLMIRKSLWDTLGGFDRRYSPGYYEDADLAMRVREAGYQVLYQPHSVIIHCEGVSAGTETDRGMKAFQQRNQQRFVERWHQVLTQHPQRQPAERAALNPPGTKHAVFIDATTPTPDQDAGSNVALEHMRLLQKLGYAVSFIPLDDFSPMPRYTAALQAEGIETIHQPFYSDLESWLRERGSEIDLAYVHRYTVAEEAIPQLRQRAPQARILFNNADLHFLRLSREAELKQSDSLHQLAQETRERELAVIRSADATLLCNQVELQLLKELTPDAQLHYLPWAMKIPPRSRVPFAKRSGIMFLGGFGHPPNVDAVQFFVHDVMPLLRQRIPGIKFHIYGSKVNDEVRALACEDVIVEGFVPDLATAFSRHRLSVAPLRFGAGFKGKVAESLAYAVPVIVSPIAAEGTGLDMQHGLRLADSASTYSNAVSELYLKPVAWRLAAEAAFNTANHRYSEASAIAHLAVAIKGLTARSLRA